MFMMFVCTATVSADSYDYSNYKPNNTTVKITETNLPIVFISTKGNGNSTKAIHYDYRIAVRMKIINNENGINYGDTLAHPNQKTDYEGWVAIKYRGNSSFTLSSKKPYSIKTLKTDDVEGKKQAASIMGMAEDNDWALIAPFADRSLIRDVLMFQLARPYFDFTPSARHCELILDGTYYGVYVMTERVRKGPNRLNLEYPGDSGDELTGGYQVQVDRRDEQYYYTSKHVAVNSSGRAYSWNNRIYFQYKHPEYDEMMPQHPQQLRYLQQQIDAMENALAGDNFRDTEEGYRKYLDEMSFIDQQLSQEVANNVDGYRLSNNIYKYRDSYDPRFKTALWDFNIAFGNANYQQAWRTDFWTYQNTYITNDNAENKVPFWWMRLMEDPDYVALLKERWQQYRRENYSNEHVTATIDSLVTMLDAKGARQRNYQAWRVWGKSIWPIPNYNTVNTWEKEISYLKNWIIDRLTWMDSQLIETNVYDITFNKQIDCYYDLRGQKLNSPPQRGVFIIRYKDGTTRKMTKIL